MVVTLSEEKERYMSDRQHAPQVDENRVRSSAQEKLDRFDPRKNRAVGRPLPAEAVEAQIGGLSRVQFRLGATEAVAGADAGTLIAVCFMARVDERRLRIYRCSDSGEWLQYDFTLVISNRPNADTRRRRREAGVAEQPSGYRWRS